MEQHLLVKKIYPTAEECRINNLVKCTEEGCEQIFTSESNLTLHVLKTHKKSSIKANRTNEVTKQFYCPEDGCCYQNNKFFKTMKLLRQHYLKVHMPKELNCSTCNKKFSSSNKLKCHSEYCGIDFKCMDCDVYYSCYDTLKTHARRKKHSIQSKYEYKRPIRSSVSTPNISKCALILPKNCISLVLIPDSDRMFNQSSQTIVHQPLLKSKMTQVSCIIDCHLNSQQTQTGTKNNHFTIETQTIGDFATLDSKSSDDLLHNVSLKSSKTQTDLVESRSTSSNTLYNFNDVDFVAQVETTSSSTQTHNKCSDIYSSSTSTHDSIHTDTSDLINGAMSSINNFVFDNCHMETQTDFMLDEGMFDCDYMSNMYTQTCDDIFNEFGFNNDIETQTAFDDMLRSIESQTTMSYGKKPSTNCKDTAHTETQTEMECRQMLEIIHS